jgi:NAD(P) transhydrogenase
MLALLGTQVTVVDRLRRPMRRIDDELADELAYCLRGSGVSLKFGRAVIAIRCTPDGPRVLLDGGEKEHVDAVLVAAGRRPDLDQIQVDAAGLDVEQLQLMDGLIRTQQEHILVVGDAAGAAGTTPAAVEQGRHAALVALGRRLPHPQSMPYVLYTTPELSFVGATEQELRLAGTPYVAGVALYRDLLRGAVAGDSFGRLKLLVHSETRAILGVHVLGRSAAELVHIGQTAMAGGLRLDFFSQAAFNYPTFSTAYTEAALDAAMKLPQRRAK